MNADTALQKIRMHFPLPDYSASVSCELTSYKHDDGKVKCEFSAKAWIAGANATKCQEYHAENDITLAKAVAKLVKGRSAKSAYELSAGNDFFRQVERMAS